jgi:hypothetical protein
MWKGCYCHLLLLENGVTHCGKGVTVTYGFDNLGDAMWRGCYCHLWF